MTIPMVRLKKFILPVSIGLALAGMAGTLAAAGAKGETEPQESVPAAEEKKETPAEPAWGGAVEGVQARLVADKVQWKRGEMPSFKVEVRNRGKRELQAVQAPQSWRLRFYNRWYVADKLYTGAPVAAPLGPGAECKGIWLSFAAPWGWRTDEKRAPKPLLLLWPGKESVRVAFTLQPAKGVPGAPVTVESNDVEIEILPETGDPAVFAGTSGIELRTGYGRDEKTVVLTDKTAIERLLKTIRLDEKGPCECEHMESAVFTTPKGRIEVSLCDHCFDFGGKYWKMPAELHKLFMSYFLPPPAVAAPADSTPQEKPKPEVLRKAGRRNSRLATVAQTAGSTWGAEKTQQDTVEGYLTPSRPQANAKTSPSPGRGLTATPVAPTQWKGRGVVSAALSIS